LIFPSECVLSRLSRMKYYSLCQH